MKKTGVVAFAFGTPSSLPSNHMLGGIASMSAFRKGIPYYTQEDIPEVNPCTRTVHPQSGNNPPSTLLIARGVVAWAKELGIQRLLVVAAPRHIQRALRDLHKTALESGVSIELMSVDPKPQDDFFWFSENSTQLRARFCTVWRVRDFILMNMPWWLYKIVAI